MDRRLAPISPTEKPDQVSPGATTEAPTLFPGNVTVVDPAELENTWYTRLQEVEDEPEWEEVKEQEVVLIKKETVAPTQSKRKLDETGPVVQPSKARNVSRSGLARSLPGTATSLAVSLSWHRKPLPVQAWGWVNC